MQNFKKNSPLFFFLVLTFTCNSQINFEKGYFLDNSGKKTICLIKNIDWFSNPSDFHYKISVEGEEQIKDINSVSEFGIESHTKYRRVKVKIDRSSEDVNEMSTERRALFKEETLFLKVLVEGKASLYEYVDGNLRRYFYSLEQSDIQQLVYKSFIWGKDKIGKNTRFKQQLSENLKCDDLTSNDFERLDYHKESLVDFFGVFNICSGASNTNFEEKVTRKPFNFTLRPGIQSSLVKIRNSSTVGTFPSITNFDFDNEIGFRIGLEIEWVMPFNKDKWSLLVEPTYQYLKSEKTIEAQTAEIDYTFMEFPFGIRHYMFLNENSKLFVNGSVTWDIALNQYVKVPLRTNFESKSSPSAVFGFGYKYGQNYSVELRYSKGRDILSDYISWSGKHQSLALIIGYAIF